MAVGVPGEGVRALSDALGLKWCRDATIRIAVGEVVTVNTQSYATDDQLKALTEQIVSRRMVLVDVDEYARLKEIERVADLHRRMEELVEQGAVSLNDARWARGLPPLPPQEPTP